MHAIVGQDQAVALLGKAVQSDRVHHAYLLTGPERVGKSALAIAFARLLHCAQPLQDLAEETPTERLCRACRLILRGVHPDVRAIELGEERGRISYKEIELLQADALLKPLEGRYKCYLILGAHRLSDTAANQLLKTLEEPPEHVVLLLTAPERETLLPTIVSRCQEVRLGRVPSERIAAHLRARFQLAPEEADRLARFARGRAGWAIQAASEPEVLHTRTEAFEQLRRALSGSRLQQLQVARTLADRWSAQPHAVRETLQLWTEWLSDALSVKTRLEHRVVHTDQLSDLRQVCDRFGASQLAHALAAVDRVMEDLRANANPRLALDVAVLSLGRGGASARA